MGSGVRRSASGGDSSAIERQPAASASTGSGSPRLLRWNRAPAPSMLMISPILRRATQSFSAARASACWRRRLASSGPVDRPGLLDRLLLRGPGQLVEPDDQVLVDRAVGRSGRRCSSTTAGRPDRFRFLKSPVSRCRQPPRSPPSPAEFSSGCWWISAESGIDPGADPDDQDRDVVQAAAQVGQVDEVPAGVARDGSSPAKAPSSWSSTGPGEPVGAEQDRRRRARRPAAPRCRPRSRLRAEAAGDHVLGDGDPGLFRGQVIATDQLPDQAVIERELIDPLAADAIDPRIADVRDQGPFGQQQQRRAGRPHPLEFAIGRGPAVDQGADVAERLDDRLGRRRRPGSSCSCAGSGRRPSCWPARPTAWAPIPSATRKTWPRCRQASALGARTIV